MIVHDSQIATVSHFRLVSSFYVLWTAALKLLIQFEICFRFPPRRHNICGRRKLPVAVALVLNLRHPEDLKNLVEKSMTNPEVHPVSPIVNQLWNQLLPQHWLPSPITTGIQEEICCQRRIIVRNFLILSPIWGKLFTLQVYQSQWLPLHQMEWLVVQHNLPKFPWKQNCQSASASPIFRKDLCHKCNQQVS